MNETHPSNWRPLLAFGAAAAVLIAVTSVAFRGTIVSNESNRWADHTAQVLGDLQNLIFDVSETESAYHGYIVLGDSSYLESLARQHDQR